ncbi:uncharacterized protein LOC100679964 isoform X1 [Nasonia vitripennis]|uniref:Transmembrane protein 72 n=2 Tax=Nasonia vitripennis TaxID=7425 RepID=A0A7M7GFY7_NASVI|nr:uncharacterized protein LOC100679964 isoform X1 [Nasonia vitripennis]
MSGKFAERNLTALSRIVGVFAAVVTCGVGVDMAFHGHVLGYYVLVLSAITLFLEIEWVIDKFVQVCIRNEESFGVRCWSVTLAATSGWRRGLFYLPVACLLAWKPHQLWLAFFDAGLLVILSAIHAAISALDYRSTCECQQASHSMGESLLHTNPDCYNHFEEVLVTEVLDDCVSSRPGFGGSDGEL